MGSMPSKMQIVLTALVASLVMGTVVFAREIGRSRCGDPPVTNAEQAVCFARSYLEGTPEGADWKRLKAEAFEHDESVWVVEFIDERPGVLGGGGQVTVDVKSGKVTGLRRTR